MRNVVKKSLLFIVFAFFGCISDKKLDVYVHADDVKKINMEAATFTKSGHDIFLFWVNPYLIYGGNMKCPNKGHKHTSEKTLDYIEFATISENYKSLIVICSECQYAYLLPSGKPLKNEKRAGNVNIYNASFDPKSSTYHVWE